MRSSAANLTKPIRAKRVRVSDALVTVEFLDGRHIAVPTTWYPRLLHGTHAERAKIEIWDDGIYWPRLDADISYRALSLGLKSGESAASLRRWLSYRARGEEEPITTLPLPPAMARAIKRRTNGATRRAWKSAK